MQMPNIQPNDVFTPIATAGQAAGNALATIGKNVDTYNLMKQMLADKRGRAQLRGQLIKEAGLSDENLPKNMTADELSDFSNKVNAFRAMLPDIEKYKIMSAAEKRVISLAAASVGERDDSPFWKLLGAVDEKIQEEKKRQGVSAESGRLQDISTGLTSQQEPIEMPGIQGMPAQGPQEPSQRMQDVGTGMAARSGAQSIYTGEPTLQGAMKAVSGAGVDVEKVGKESMDAYQKQFRSEQDIAASQAKETGTGGDRADKGADRARALENEANALKKEKRSLQQYLLKITDPKTKSISQQMIASLVQSDPEFAKMVGGSTDPETVKKVIEDNDVSITQSIISKAKQFNRVVPAGASTMDIGGYVDFVEGVKTKRGKEKKAGAGAAKAAPAPAAGGIPAPKTQAEYNALPPGTVYLDGDGMKKRKK